ncbi:uncharacterized protein LOC755341 [Strongylocentrotus purpuratus]|uniref:Uncharacterized protein n=1 Tax=Strongylocentrotus purpuratus TaxID=7668 RepID=A0A7M7NGI5_STRPU|nr:uncharacterized protein LOC755341 [Strongylocentrotus purpuratus]
MKRENDRLVDEDSRDNCDQQHEESVEALNNHDNVNEDDSIDIVSEVNKEAQFVGENGNDEENVGQMKGDQDAEILDNDDDDDDVGDSISVNGSPRDAGRYENDDSYKNTDLTATVKTGDKKVESKEGNRRSSMKSAKSTKKSKTVRVKSSKTVSSIEVDMTRIIRNEDDDDFDADEDDDAVTRVTCGKSVDFSIPVDELDEELQRVIDRPGSGRTSMMDNEDMIGLGRAATMNTPVTIDDRESYVYPQSIRTQSRDGMYQHAVDLIHNRCGSVSFSTRSQPHARRRETRPPPRSAASLPEHIPTTLLGGVPMFNLPNVVKHINKTPFNDQPNSYFYISQSKPVPLKPMKVWKGYRGNVYFEPMVCRRAPFSSASSNPKPNERVASSHLPVIPKSAEITTNGAPANPAHFNSHSATTSRSQPPNGRRTAASGAKSATSTRSSGRQLAILDKTTVLSRMDYNAAEDIKWISGIESTGTLQIGPSGDKLAGRAYKVYRNGPKHPKLRIRRGLVSHNLAGNNKNSPKFGVSGGRINEDLTTNRNANPTNRTQKRNSVQEHHGVSQSYPSDNYCCVDSMTPLQQIMKRNDGHGRSKLVHILPSAYGDGGIGSIRPKGK